MVYHTPQGERILENAERELFVHSLAMMVDMLDLDDAQFGIAAFDQLTRNQKLVVLYSSASALLHRGQPAPELTAAIEGSVASVYEHARQEVCDEVEDHFWRSKVLAAIREVAPDLDELPDVTSRDTSEWSFLVETLADCVLWDSDYDLQATLDIPPEASRRLKGDLGIDNDYFTAIPPDPPDEQLRLYVDALVGLCTPCHASIALWRKCPGDHHRSDKVIESALVFLVPKALFVPA